MIDLYLRADDEAAMNAALVAARLMDAAGQPAEGVALDIIGTITRIEGDEPVTLPGWHVNVRLADLSDAQAAALTGISMLVPANPFRVFA
ncbi:MAG: hypothetical protein MUF47_08870 [Porphyrobacter sp.]|nr:hypothetical protein [Porphyrobacter sp.]